jgi:hypothetical protein
MVDPNRITQFLIAALAGLQVSFVCSETLELGEQLVGSYLYQVHLYHWFETNDYGRFDKVPKKGNILAERSFCGAQLALGTRASF